VTTKSRLFLLVTLFSILLAVNIVAAQDTPYPPPALPGPQILTPFVPRVNVRSGPGTGFERIGVINEGESFVVTGIEHIWYIIDFYGQPGYVSGELVYVTSGPPTGGGELDPRPVVLDGVYYTPNSNLWLRDAPTQLGERLGLIRFGAVLRVLGRTEDNNWVQVEIEGATGWVAAWFGTYQGDYTTLPITGESPTSSSGQPVSAPAVSATAVSAPAVSAPAATDEPTS